jgi:putative FmdB family regulatory protein
MPTYEYQCDDCHQNFSAILTITEHEHAPAPACPSCGSKNVTQQISGPSVITSRKS